jgi:hypothetical protein
MASNVSANVAPTSFSLRFYLGVLPSSKEGKDVEGFGLPTPCCLAATFPLSTLVSHALRLFLTGLHTRSCPPYVVYRGPLTRPHCQSLLCVHICSHILTYRCDSAQSITGHIYWCFLFFATLFSACCLAFSLQYTFFLPLLFALCRLHNLLSGIPTNGGIAERLRRLCRSLRHLPPPSSQKMRELPRPQIAMRTPTCHSSSRVARSRDQLHPIHRETHARPFPFRSSSLSDPHSH